ncbi:DUF1007 family protein [Vibrio quintilis]|uniref:DUF1007 family protein n=1 Tax=Vibrio quintilis TaxID=1117707 RepID=UPI001F480B0F|nr:DUF1007 family protein [Vibrio quintilis]
MIKRLKQISPRIVFCLFLLSLPYRTFAHPHSWMDLQTYIKSSQTALTGFSMIWTFDPMTTAYLFDGEDMSDGHREQTLQKLADSMIRNMLSTHYFTYFYDQKTPVRYQKVKTAKLTTHAGKATLSFELDLVKPYPFNGRTLQLRIFDPTYYVDMSWKSHKDVILESPAKAHCSTRLKEPHPTPAQVSYAMSIPADADPDDTLGQLFTQTIELTCHP